MQKLLIVIFLLLLTPFAMHAGIGDMNPKRMKRIIEKFADDVQEDGRLLQFTYQSVGMMLVYDESADRMRLVSPIIKVEDLEEGQLLKAMQANYHRALDARYAVSEGVVWSAFIHPMSELSKDFLESAIEQVAIARLTFGKEYTSGALQFGGDGED